MRRILRIVVIAVTGFVRDECFSYAASIAYWSLFSIFPLALLVVAVLSQFVHGVGEREAAIGAVFSLFGQSVGRNLVVSQIDALAQSGGRAGFISLALALWTASSVFAAIRAGMAAVWGTRSRRPLLQGKLLDLVMVVIVGLLILLSMATTAVLTAVSEFSTQLFGSEIGTVTAAIVGVCFFVIPPAISYLAFGLVYYVVPRGAVRLGAAMRGAGVAAILFQVAQVGFSLYLSHFANYGHLYGSLGAVIALLTFMFLSASILLFGAEVARAYAAGVRFDSLTPSPGSA